MNLTDSNPGAADRQLFSAERVLRWVEAVGVFMLGFALMSYFYAASTPNRGDEIGAPGHDSFYHVAMASMLPEHGLLREFPWLRHTYFRDQGHDFVSHHFGFHLLLLPFVKAAEWLTGDALAGGRWAISAVFGANLLLFHLLLRQRRVPWRWLWIALFLLLPDQFFARHAYVRAIGPSLMFMQLILLAMFARRYWLAALAIAAYVQLYLGAVFYGPVIVAVFAGAQLAAPREEREIPWKLTLLTAAGWAVGVFAYPYSAGMFEFLKMQVFGSGLSPDIEVGREWLPYTDAWFLIKMAATLLSVWVAALLLRLRLGPRLDARETALVALQFIFLLLTFKARRFIEYWPPICLLSTAYLAAAPLARLIETGRSWFAARGGGVRIAAQGAGILALAGACTAAWNAMDASGAAGALLAEWRVWAALILVLALPALVRAGSAPAAADGQAPLGRVLAVCAGGLTVFGACALAAWGARGADAGTSRMTVPGFAWGLLVVAYALIPLFTLRRIVVQPLTRPAALAHICAIVLLALTLPAATIALGAPAYASAAQQVRCFYNLADTREVMAYLKSNANPGDVIFTDDWDVFPLYFYHNRYNHYIVGLDPKFTHQREPDLWNRYVKISRGEIPSTIRLVHETEDGQSQAIVGLEDIRERFGARYVLADSDHRRLTEALARTPELAELVFPEGTYEQVRHAPYLIFRMRERDEAAEFAATRSTAPAPTDGPTYLSEMRPLAASQGWGELGADRSVDGNPIRLGGDTYLRGLGAHAPAKLLYSVPAGAAWFEALVGIDDETDGNGSAVAAVAVDGQTVYESPRLSGGAPPASVRIPLQGARQIQLEARPTEDGQTFDHVSWANARFVSANDEGASQEAVVAAGDAPAIEGR